MAAGDEFARKLRESCGYFVLLGALDRGGIEGEVATQTRAGIRFVEFCAYLQQLSRNWQEFVEDQRDEMLLIAQLTGNALVSQHESSHRLQPGDLALIDGSEPCEFTYFGEFSRQRIAFLPRAAALAALEPARVSAATFCQSWIQSIWPLRQSCRRY